MGAKRIEWRDEGFDRRGRRVRQKGKRVTEGGTKRERGKREGQRDGGNRERGAIIVYGFPWALPEEDAAAVAAVLQYV